MYKSKLQCNQILFMYARIDSVIYQNIYNKIVSNKLQGLQFCLPITYSQQIEIIKVPVYK